MHRGYSYLPPASIPCASTSIQLDLPHWARDTQIIRALRPRVISRASNARFLPIRTQGCSAGNQTSNTLRSPATGYCSPSQCHRLRTTPSSGVAGRYLATAGLVGDDRNRHHVRTQPQCIMLCRSSSTLVLRFCSVSHRGQLEGLTFALIISLTGQHPFRSMLRLGHESWTYAINTRPSHIRRYGVDGRSTSYSTRMVPRRWLCRSHGTSTSTPYSV